jgi:hypothetical protein
MFARRVPPEVRFRGRKIAFLMGARVGFDVLTAEPKPGRRTCQAACFPTLDPAQRMRPEHFRAHMSVFPEGQHVVRERATGRVAASSIDFRTRVDFGQFQHRYMRVLQEETFGPVAPIAPFRDEAEAIARANATSYGLAAYLWTRDLSRAMRVAEALEYGIVGVNDGVPTAMAPQAPFGGMKDSGIGREGGRWGLEEYLEVKLVSIALS